MKRLRPLVYVLVAAQLLLSAPVVSALTSAPTSGAMPCAEMMPAGDSHPCPCCPDDTGSMAQCLSACTAAHINVAAQPALRSSNQTSFASAPLFVPLAAFSEPPIKPPPIR